MEPIQWVAILLTLAFLLIIATFVLAQQWARTRDERAKVGREIRQAHNTMRRLAAQQHNLCNRFVNKFKSAARDNRLPQRVKVERTRLRGATCDEIAVMFVSPNKPPNQRSRIYMIVRVQVDTSGPTPLSISYESDDAHTLIKLEDLADEERIQNLIDDACERIAKFTPPAA